MTIPYIIGELDGNFILLDQDYLSGMTFYVCYRGTNFEITPYSAIPDEVYGTWYRFDNKDLIKFNNASAHNSLVGIQLRKEPVDWEPLSAKLRNKLTSLWNLPDMIELYFDADEKMKDKLHPIIIDNIKQCKESKGRIETLLKQIENK